jgi:hypothetical protein
MRHGITQDRFGLAFDVERDTAQTLLPEKFGTATE